MNTELIQLTILFFIATYFWHISSALPQWTDHRRNVSTLKLLQIVHRHGERTPMSFLDSDPFQNASTFWPEGIEQLTVSGKYRMYKLGEFIRLEYGKYLGEQYSPREVYARSSIRSRCMESLASVLAGAYPPHNKWQWNAGRDGNVDLGTRWQPIPIETFMPAVDDTLLVADKLCPNAENDRLRALRGDGVKRFMESRDEFLRNLSEIVGERLDTLPVVQRFWDTLDIETEQNHIWPNFTSRTNQAAIVSELREFSQQMFLLYWNTPLARRARAGQLIRALVDNMRNESSAVKLYLYSTHDSVVAPLMQALGVFNDLVIPYGAAVIFELHEVSGTNRSIVRLFYFNDTLNAVPRPLKLERCSAEDCPLDEFVGLAREWYYDSFDELCGIETKYKVSELSFVAIGFGVGVLVTVSVMVCMFSIWQSTRRKDFELNDN